jgi:hypothetical protein
MKTQLSTLLLVLLLTLTSPAAPKGKAKGKPGVGKAEAPATPTPAMQLAPYVEKIQMLLALRPPDGPAPLRAQAPGKLAVLKTEFATAKSGADKSDAPKYDAAIATCNLLLAAIDERDRTASSIRASAAVHGSEKINAPARKDALNQGVRGGDLAKAVGESEEGRRERDEKRAGHRQTVETDETMTAAAVERWKKREVELRGQITAAYAKIGA